MGLVAPILLALWLWLSCGALPLAQAEPTIPEVDAQAAIAVDTSTGLITYAKNIHRRAPMASTTKIMTALTALGTPGTNLTDIYTVVAEDLAGPNETVMGLRVGEKLTFSDLLYGLLLNSGNDAAKAISRYAGAKLPGNGDPVARFVDRMNSQASAYGLRNTHYANPHGLDQDGHYSSAFDLAITGWYALQNQTIARIVGQQKATVAGHNLTNLNTFLKRYNGANGIKTGYDDNAGLCLVASATRNGRTVVAVMMNTDQSGFNNDPVALMDYSFELLKLPDTVLRTRPPAGGGPFQSTTQYIGYPKGSVLAPAPNALAGESGVGIAGNPSNYLAGPGIAAQINTSPAPTLSSSGDDSSDNNSKDKQSGGPNLLVILFILIVIGLVVFGLGRFGYLGGETGRNLALRVEDMSVVAFRAGRKNAGRLVNSLKPGNHPDEVIEERPSPASRVTSTRSTTRPRPAEPPAIDETISNRPRSTTSYSNPQPNRPATTSRPKESNPLDGFFDDVQPFGWEEKSSGATTESSTPLKPPAPIPPMPNPTPPASTNRVQPPPPTEKERERPATPPPTSPNPPRATSYPSRPAADATPKVDLNSPVDRLRPPQPLSPRASSSAATPPSSASANPPTNSTPARNENSERGNERNYFGNPTYGKDNLQVRARQAIDYAYAGRLQASTEEFRRVVEAEPLFDFGGLEEFEQMPVLGYKALANAYVATGRSKFALLLLDMAIEKYPNDLELRNMLRTFKRDMI